MQIKEELAGAISNALKELGIESFEVKLEHPESSNHGDYSSNIAMKIFASSKFKVQSSKLQVKSQKWGNPLELAQEIVNILENNSKLKTLTSNIQTVLPGFINFWLSRDTLSKELELALSEGERYPSTHSTNAQGRTERSRSTTALRANLEGQTWMVEFAHPNTHKEFHIGHLRNITLGESLCRLFEENGAKIIRANYQGDVGLHIAQALWGIRSKIKNLKEEPLEAKIKLLAGAYVGGNKAYRDDPKAKIQIEEINKKLYGGDPELVALWQETRGWSLAYFDSIYRRLGTKFDRLYFESEVAEEGRDIVNKYLDTVFEKSDGAVIFPGERYGLHNRVFINSLGLPTYEAKDIGLAHLQFSQFNPDKIIHVVGPEQTDYFKVVFSALERVLPDTRGKEYHLPYGWVRLKSGKMSSRTGEVVAGLWLIDEVKSRLLSSYKMEEGVAETVAVGAVKYSLLRLHPKSEIAFDIEQSIRLDGESGPYLQYTYARAKSVLRRAKILNSKFEILNSLENEELALLRTFYRFPEVVEEAARQFAPNILGNFLYDLASKYNTLYNNLPILEHKQSLALRAKSKEQSDLRLALTQVTANILKTGLNLLGIAVPERM